MTIRELAASLLADYDVGRPGTLFGRGAPALGIAEAYDLQFAVAALRLDRGERVAGYKVGCISETMQRQLGIDRPVFGHLWDTELRSSGVDVAARDFDGLAIEGELAVRLLDDVPSAAWLRDNPDVPVHVLPVVELHNYVFRGPETQRAVELIANNTIHAGVVLGDEGATLKDFEVGSKLSVDRNGELLGEGVPVHLSNGVLEIVASVAEHLERHGRTLERGQLVLTGSPLPLWPVEVGDDVRVRHESLADVTCTIV